MSNCYWLLIHINYAEKISTQFDFFLKSKVLRRFKMQLLTLVRSSKSAGNDCAQDDDDPHGVRC